MNYLIFYITIFISSFLGRVIYEYIKKKGSNNESNKRKFI